MAKEGVSATNSVLLLLVVVFLIVIGYIVLHNMSVVPSLDNSMLSDNELTCSVLGIDQIVYNNESFGCAELMHQYSVRTMFMNRTLIMELI